MSDNVLRPGDLCVIVRPPGGWRGIRDMWADRTYGLTGRTVVLISSYPDEGSVYWRVSGVPSLVTGLREVLLRKIPPDEMPDYATSEEELTV